MLVQHKGFPYLLDWLGMKEIAALEPKPGVEPTIAHLSEVLDTVQHQPVKMVIRRESDRVVFVDTPSPILVDIDVRLRVP